MREPTFKIDLHGHPLYEGDVVEETVLTILGPMKARAVIRWSPHICRYRAEFTADPRLILDARPLNGAPYRVGSVYDTPNPLDA